MTGQVSAERHHEVDEFLDESPFRSSLRSVLIVDLAALSLWTAWAHPGPGGISRLALVAVWSIPALWNLLSRPVLRKLAVRRIVADKRKSAFLVLCVATVTTLLTLSTTLADSVSRSPRSIVDQQLGSVDEMILAATPELRLAAQTRLDQVLNERSQTVNDLSLLVRAQLGLVVSETIMRNDGRSASRIEQRVHVLEMDVVTAAAFGDDPQATGLANRTNPGPGKIFLGPFTASALRAQVGDSVSITDPVAGDQSFVVEAILPRRGFGVLPLDGTSTSNIAVVGTGALTTLATPPTLRYVIAIANRTGSKASTAVTERLEQAFAASEPDSANNTGALPSINVSVDNVKAQILQVSVARSQPVARLLKTLTLLLSLGAGMLLVTLFYGLAVTRTSEIAALRSVGLRRRDAVSAFGIEGWIYAAAGSLIGAAAGVVAGAAVFFAAEPANGFVTLVNAPELRSVWIGLACGFVLSGTAVAASMLLTTRGPIQRSFGVSGEATPVPGRLSNLGAAGFGAIAVVGAMLMLRSLDSKGSFSFLGGLLLVVSGCAPFLRRASAAGRDRAHLARLVGPLAVLSTGLIIGVPLLAPSWFRHSGVGTTVLYAVALLLAATLVATASAPYVRIPKLSRMPTAAGRTRAANVVANAAPRVAPKRDALLRATTASLVMVLTAIGFVRVSLREEIYDRTSSVRAGWDTVVSAPDQRTLPSLVGKIGTLGKVATVASLDVEVANARGDVVRVAATRIGSDYVTRRPATLVSRVPGLASDAAVYDSVFNGDGFVIVDETMFVDGGTRLRTVEAGEKLYLRDLRTGNTQSVSVSGVARSLPGLGAMFVGSSTATALRGGPVVPERILVGLDNPHSSGRRALAAAVDMPGVSVDGLADLADDDFAVAHSVLRSLGSLMWLGGLLAVGVLSVVMVRSARDRKQDWRALRSLGMSSEEIRRIGSSEALVLLIPAVVVGWLCGVVVAWHLVWTGALGVDAARPFSVLSVFGAISVVVVPFVAVSRGLRAAMKNDSPLRR